MLAIAAEEDLEGMTLADCLPPWLQARFQYEHFLVLLRHGIWRGEFALLSRTGRQTPVSMVALGRNPVSVHLFGQE